MPFFFFGKTIFPSLIRAELNYLGSIGQVMLLCPRCPHILFFFSILRKAQCNSRQLLIISLTFVFVFVCFLFIFRTISFLTSSAS